MFDGRILPRGHAESSFAVSDIKFPFIKLPKPAISDGVYVIECRRNPAAGWNLHSNEFYTSEEAAADEATTLQRHAILQKCADADPTIYCLYRVTRLARKD